MRVIVTGTEGQVARALRERGPASGATIETVGRPRIDLAGAKPLTEALRLLSPAVIVNAAAYTAVDKAEDEPELAALVNGRGAGLVAQAAADLGIPVVQISTDYVFDGESDRPYREGDPVGPLNVYGRSKLAGERAVAAVTENHAIVRTSWVFGPSSHNFVRTMLGLAAQRDEIPVVDDQTGSPTMALDLADGILCVCANLVERPGEAALRGVFHMAGGGSATRAALAEAVFAMSAARGGASAAVVPVASSAFPTRARRPMRSWLDSGRLGDVHEVVLPPWQDALERCIEAINPGDRP